MYKKILGIIALLFLATILYSFGKQMNADDKTPNGGNGGVQPIITPQPVVYKDLIVIDSPKVGATVSSPLMVSGKARGNWYFEASFPIDVVDTNGTLLGQGFATAQGEWMTSEYVPFTGTVTYKAPTTSSSTIRVVFKKDNPSGLPENDDFVGVEVNHTK
jgi:hypothetical protein